MVVVPRHLLSIDDLSDLEVRQLLDQARDGSDLHARPFTCGLLFLTPSLRTRVGFATAAARLGGHPIDVSETRWTPDMSEAESFEDTLRTVSGMVDIVVVRSPMRLEGSAVETAAAAPVINGGDRGGEHPTQALIDLLAIEDHAGPVGDLRIGLCGDLTARAATSLLRLFERFRPRHLALISPPSRRPVHTADADEVRSDPSFDGLDVLYMVGLPPGDGPGALDERERTRYALDARSLGQLAPDAVVLSPMPVIDEMDTSARSDPRVRMFEQSDRSVTVRMAVLALLLGKRS